LFVRRCACPNTCPTLSIVNIGPFSLVAIFFFASVSPVTDPRPRSGPHLALVELKERPSAAAHPYFGSHCANRQKTRLRESFFPSPRHHQPVFWGYPHDQQPTFKTHHSGLFFLLFFCPSSLPSWLQSTFTVFSRPARLSVLSSQLALPLFLLGRAQTPEAEASEYGIACIRHGADRCKPEHSRLCRLAKYRCASQVHKRARASSTPSSPRPYLHYRVLAGQTHAIPHHPRHWNY
jgi:hypothetical protein